MGSPLGTRYRQNSVDVIHQVGLDKNTNRELYVLTVYKIQGAFVVPECDSVRVFSFFVVCM